MFKRPFGKSELIILEGLEKYVECGREEEFCEALDAMITEESMVMEPKASRRASSCQSGVDVSGAMEVTVKLNKDQGNLELGKLSRKYITDPDIRSLLDETVLDVTKIVVYSNVDELRLITSVIYSEKFELTGGRKRQTGKETLFPLISRSLPAPILFKSCRVDFNKETNRLEIHKGEFISKTA